MDIDEPQQVDEAPKRSANIARTVRDRLVTLPDSRARHQQSVRFREYEESRMKVRARFEMPGEGSIFALKFAPTAHDASDEQYCLVAQGPHAQVWDMAGCYTGRKPGELHGGRMVLSLQQHSDIIASCEWMPSSFTETFETYLPQLQPTSVPPVQAKLTLPPFFTAGFDKKIKFHRGGLCVATMVEHDDWVRFMSICYTGERLVSGSVSSMLVGWDLSLLKPVWRISPSHVAPPHLEQSLKGINSINGLEWTHESTNIFASGAGDGSVKIWDSRILDSEANADSCVGSVIAHDGKLNNLHWLKDNRFLMTSGRDNVIRLLDMRMLRNVLDSQTPPSRLQSAPWNRDRLIVKEYAEHSCHGYNVQANLYDNDERIVTGSRTGKIFIYETWTGRLAKILDGPTSTAHLVVPLPPKCGRGFISAAGGSSTLLVWGPSSTTENTREANLSPQEELNDEETAIELARQEALELTVAQFDTRFLEALRHSRPYNTILQDENVRTAYNRHIRASLVRRGYAIVQNEAGVSMIQAIRPAAAAQPGAPNLPNGVD